MVIISGASSGIGEACARVFAEKKCSLILLARRKDRLDALAKELKEANGIEVHPFAVDVRDRTALEKLVIQNRPLFEKAEVLVNNAGMARGREPIQLGNPENWDEMIDTNIKGFLYLTHVILPFFVGKGRGHVVNLGSIAGHWTYPDGNVYCATKHAVRALNETMRLDLHGTGVRVTEIAPGMVETEFSEVRFGGDKEKARAIYQGMTPLTARDIAEAVVWSVERPAHVNIQEMVIFPTDQASSTMVKRKQI